jgi:hypothetical protein
MKSYEILVISFTKQESGFKTNEIAAKLKQSRDKRPAAVRDSEL